MYRALAITTVSTPLLTCHFLWLCIAITEFTSLANFIFYDFYDVFHRALLYNYTKQAKEMHDFLN